MAALALVDFGATGIFLYPQFVKEYSAVVRPREYPREVTVIDGRVINSGLITYKATVQLVIGDHCETLVGDIMNTRKYSCNLGTRWLVRHDSNIRWSRGDVQFDSLFFLEQCIHQGTTSRSTCKSRWMLGLVASKHAMVAATAFQLLAKDAKIYALEICECNGPKLVSIPLEYHDLSELFSKNASNKLPNQCGPSDMKIDFKEG